MIGKEVYILIWFIGVPLSNSEYRTCTFDIVVDLKSDFWCFVVERGVCISGAAYVK